MTFRPFRPLCKLVDKTLRLASIFLFGGAWEVTQLGFPEGKPLIQLLRHR